MEEILQDQQQAQQQAQLQLQNQLQNKLEALQAYLKKLERVAVAFSGGVDSTMLLTVAKQTLGAENVMAITARSRSFPERERSEAIAYCRELGVKQCFVDCAELQVEGFIQNPPNRCYICKKALFTEIGNVAAANGMLAVAEGSNMDDNGDYRPGLQAVEELGVKSPLRHVQLSKAEIRALSKILGLPTWKKQSFACLASRFVYGEPITEDKLEMVEKAEDYLLACGFKQMRVRIHGTKDPIARIELLAQDLPRMLDEELRTRTWDYLKEIGFAYVSLDLMGYRMGSMNEALGEDALSKQLNQQQEMQCRIEKAES